MKIRFFCAYLIPNFCWAILISPAGAAIFNNATLDSKYDTPGNWDSNAVPTGSVAASIGSGGSQSAVYDSATGYTTSGILTLGAGSGASGALTLSGSAGALAFGTVNIGTGGGSGSLTVNAGTLTATAADLNLTQSGALVPSTIIVGGGTLNVGNRFIIGDGNIAGSTVTLSSGAINTTNSVVFGGGGAGSATTSVFNLDGGTLNVGAGVLGGAITRYRNAGTYTFNFNGGTLKNTAASGTLLAYSGAGSFEGGGTGITYNVLSGGAIFDTTGGNATATATLAAASGNGGLTKTGTNTLTLASIATGNPLNITVNNGTLSLARTGLAYNNSGGSGNGGSITVYAGTTLKLSAAYNVGYQQQVNINGGTLDLVQNVTGDGQNYTLNLNLSNGGSIISSTGSSLRWGELGNATITVTGTTPSTISSNLYMIGGGGFAGTIDVVDPAGILNYSGVIQKHSYSGVITGVPLIKTGAGTLNLSGANTYTNATTVNAGTLLVTGSMGNTPVTVSSGGTLAGTGAIAGTVSVNGSIKPGNGGIGTLTVNNTVTLQTGSTTTMQIDKTLGVTTADKLFVNSISYGGTLQITATGETLAPGDSFQLFDSLAYGGAFASFALPTLDPGLSWDLSGLSSNGTITVVDTLPTPAFTPTAGGYIGPVTITVNCNEPGTTIYYTYTTDGSPPPNPTTSSNQGTAGSSTAILNMAADSILSVKAMAVKAGSANSPVAQADFGSVNSPVWTFDGSGNWSDPANWNRGAIGQGVGVAADFGTVTQTGGIFVSLDGSRTIGSLAFGDSGNTYGTNISATSGSVLTLDNGASASVISVANQTTNISASLTGNLGLRKTGTGTLGLAGSNSYGPTTVQAGTLVADAANALPSGQGVSVSNGNLRVNSASGQYNWFKFVTSTAIGSGGTLDLAGSATEIHNLTLSGGTLSGSAPDTNYGSWGFNTIFNVEPIVATGGVTSTISASRFDSAWDNPLTFQVETGSTLDVTGIIGGNPGHGAFGVTKTGTGTLILAATNAYTGATLVTHGIVLVNGALNAGSAVTVLSGAALGGSGTAAGTVAVQTGATLSPGNSAVGTLAAGSLTLAGTYACEISSGSADRVDVTGDLNLTGGSLVFSEVSPPTAASYILATCTGTLTGTMTATGTPAGYTVVYDTSNRQVLLSKDGYVSWIADTGLTGNDTLPGADPDDDGIPNGIEFVIGNDPESGVVENLPTITVTGSDLVFEFRRTDISASSNPVAQVSSDLSTGSWSDVTTGISVDDDFFGSGIDRVTVTIPRGANSRMFARLSVSIP